jgi:hypothetical protein
MGQLAKEKIKKILDSHEPEALPVDVAAEIDKVLARAKSR